MNVSKKERARRTKGYKGDASKAGAAAEQSTASKLYGGAKTLGRRARQGTADLFSGGTTALMRKISGD